MFPIRILAAAALLSMGCAHLDYLGETYEPTTRIDLYFSKEDVPRDYKVMGQMIANGDEYLSTERLQERVMAQAREKGADAIIILGLARVPVSHQQQLTEKTTITKEDSGKTIVKTSTVSEPAEGTEIRALFIKYRSTPADSA